MDNQDNWQDYTDNSRLQYERSLRHIKSLDLASEGCTTIVELGSNSANLSRTLAQQYPQKQFIAIDLDETIIKQAEQQHADRSNLKLICDSAQRFNLLLHNMPQAKIIAFYHALHWIERKELPHVFSNIAENLDEGGIVDIITAAYPTVEERDLEACKSIQEAMDLFQKPYQLESSGRAIMFKPKWWGETLRSCLAKRNASNLM